MNLLHGHTTSQQFSNGIDVIITELTDIIQQFLVGHIIKLSQIDMVYTDLQRTDALEQALLQVGADTHDLTGSLHLCTQQVGCRCKLIEGETGQLGDHIIQLGLKGCIRISNLDLFQSHTHGDLCGHTGNGITGSLGCQRRGTGNTRVHLDQIILATGGMQCILHITTAFDLQFTNDLNSRIVQLLLLLGLQSHDGRHNDRVTGMNTNRVDVFHTADGNGMVSGVTHDLKLNLLIALNTLLNQNLVYRRQLKGIQTDLNQFFLVVCEAATGTAQSKGRTQNNRIANAQSSFLGFLDGVSDLRGNHRLTDGLTHFLKQLSVLSTLNGFAAGTQQLHTTLLQNALLLQLHSQVQTGLTANAGNNGIGTLKANDLCNILQGQRLHINLIRNGSIGHNGSGVGVAQNYLIALFLQSQASLCACIVEFCSLADHDRTGTNNQNLLNVCSLSHNYLLYTIFPSQMVITHCPCNCQPAKGVAFPMDANSSGFTVNSASRSHTVQH